jgi:hypothetical protein
MGYPAVAAEGQQLNIVSKTWLGDRQLYIDDYGRSWIMGLYGLEIHDGNVPEAAAVVPAAEGDLAPPLSSPEAPVEADTPPEVETTIVDEDQVPVVDPLTFDLQPYDNEPFPGEDGFEDEAVIPAQPDDPAADA